MSSLINSTRSIKLTFLVIAMMSFYSADADAFSRGLFKETNIDAGHWI